MITLIMSSIANFPDFYRIIGYVLMCIEALMIIVRLMYNFTPENTKFSKFLETMFKGLSKSKHTLNNPISEDLGEKILDEKEENKDSEENKVDEDE